MHQDDPVSLYIVTQPNDKARLRPLVRVMVNMIVRLLADKMDFENGRPVAHYKHRLLMMLDEFPSLGSSKSCRSRWLSSPATASSAT
jgi:type IV secretion system protein VirD4